MRMSVEQEEKSPAAPARMGSLGRGWQYVAAFGPGLITMMADTDVGSVITAAQSGTRWGFALLPLQFLLIPVLFTLQELTVRLGLFTGRGHGELIRERSDKTWGAVSAGGLLVAVLGAMVTEFSGIAGVGAMLGIPRAFSLGLAVSLLPLVVGLGSYRRVEWAVLSLSLFELAFFWTAVKAHPQPNRLAEKRAPAIRGVRHRE